MPWYQEIAELNKRNFKNNTQRVLTGVLLLLLMLIALTGCGGNVDNVQISDWKPSEIYSDDDIEAAFKAVKDYFSQEFDGCTLTQLYYPGDSYADEFNEWAERYGSDEAIVILSSFDVDSSGGDGSLNPNSTYTDWKWVLIRSGGGWEHADHGY
ncbi:MAG: hypothetical protein LUC36_01090 [Oscillospiraceae bacterium]|nr:hypothetical protein [Oscillospiraceae bacterium]